MKKNLKKNRNEVDGPVPVVAYVRVSSAAQAESGLSLEAQRQRVQAYAALYGLRIVTVLEDAGESAKSLKRPGLAQALAMIDRGEAHGLLVTKLDRLSRDLGDWAHLIGRYFGDRAKTPAQLHSVGDKIDTATAAGRLALNLLMSISQWEREVIGERTAAALAVKRARGELTSGCAPIGVQAAADGRTAVPHEGEQEAIARIRELRAQGHSTRAIADALNASGVVCRGARWHRTTVCRVLGRLAT